MTTSPASPDDGRKERAIRLKLHGMVAHWDEYADTEWLETLLAHEEDERQRRGLERRIRNARIGRFKLLADFDWSWPKKVDRAHIEQLFELDFLAREPGQVGDVLILGPNGVGKTMLAQNLAYHAVLRGHSVRFVTASEMLNDLAAQESAAALTRSLRRYCRPMLLACDELGYLSYDSRHADLLFEVVSRRHGQKSTVITTNRPFSEWNAVFPSATSIVALVDRLVHRAEVVTIEGASYRLKEADERRARRAAEGTSRRKRKPKP